MGGLETRATTASISALLGSIAASMRVAAPPDPTPMGSEEAMWDQEGAVKCHLSDGEGA